MFLPKQKRFLRIIAAQQKIDLHHFVFSETEKELRLTHKPSGFYFRVVELDLSKVRVNENTLYIYYTPTQYGVTVNPTKESHHSAESWELVEKSLIKWLDWIKQEFEESIEYSFGKLNSESITPQVSITPVLGHLHLAVQQAVGARFADGYYSDALHKACTALEKAIQVRASQPPEPTGATLMSKVFSKDKPLLEVSSNQGEQEGYMFLYRGLAQAIRNHYAHNDPATDPARALEWLSFISALFYKLDEAQPPVPTPAI